MNVNFENFVIDGINIDDIEEIKVFTPEGTKTFNIKRLNAVEGSEKNFLQKHLIKVLQRIWKRIGVLKVVEEGNIERIDLTRQLVKPMIIKKQD